MRLSPLDIKKQEFSRGFRGFEEQEVAAYLQMLGDQWDELLTETRALESKVTDLENKLVHYQRVEDALQEALNTAKSSSKTKIAHAEQEAGLILREATQKADEIINRAKTSNQTLEHNNMLLEQRRQQISSRLRAFLTSEMDMLSSFENQPLPNTPAPIRLPTEHMHAGRNPVSRLDAQEDAQQPEASPPSKAMIHNVEVDVNQYANEVSGSDSDWSGDQESESDFFSDNKAEGLGESGHEARQGEPASVDATKHEADRPPQKENVSPTDMDKIRKILDNLD